MSTEDVRDLSATGSEAIDLIVEDQIYAAKVVKGATDQLYYAVQQASLILQENPKGRLIYAGAGTPARLGFSDGSELTPTFAWPVERVGYVIAGGEQAVLKAVEGAEDNKDHDAEKQMADLKISASDVVIAVSASGRTPFTVAAMQSAKENGAFTIGVAHNTDAPLLKADAPILLETGAEIVGGSTRMKAGTAQAILLKSFSTAVMNELGFVYNGFMVAVRPTNDKLKARAVGIIKDISGCSIEHAQKCLIHSEQHIKYGDVRVALLLATGKTLQDSVQLLENNAWNFGKALNQEAITFSGSSHVPSSDHP